MAKISMIRVSVLVGALALGFGVAETAKAAGECKAGFTLRLAMDDGQPDECCKKDKKGSWGNCYSLGVAPVNGGPQKPAAAPAPTSTSSLVAGPAPVEGPSLAPAPAPSSADSGGYKVCPAPYVATMVNGSPKCCPSGKVNNTCFGSPPADEVVSNDSSKTDNSAAAPAQPTVTATPAATGPGTNVTVNGQGAGTGTSADVVSSASNTVGVQNLSNNKPKPLLTGECVNKGNMSQMSTVPCGEGQQARISAMPGDMTACEGKGGGSKVVCSTSDDPNSFNPEELPANPSANGNAEAGAGGNGPVSPDMLARVMGGESAKNVLADGKAQIHNMGLQAGLNNQEMGKATAGLAGDASKGLDAHKRNSVVEGVSGSDASSKLGYASDTTTKDMAMGFQVANQAADAAGAMVVNGYGQAQQLEAANANSPNAAYEAAASTARAASVQQFATGGVALAEGAIMMVRRGQHAGALDEVRDGQSSIKAAIDGQTDDKSAGRNAGLSGTGLKAGQGRVDIGESAFAKKLNNAVDLNTGYTVNGNAAQCGDPAIEQQAETNIIRNLGSYGFQERNGRYLSMEEAKQYDTLKAQNYQQAMMYLDEVGQSQQQLLTGTNEKSKKVQALVSHRCQEQIRLNRVAGYQEKGEMMKSDTNKIAGRITEQQNQGKDAAMTSAMTNFIQGAVKVGQGVMSQYLAGMYDKLANRAAAVKDGPQIDMEFDPLAQNDGTPANPGGQVNGFGSGETFAAGTEDEPLKEEEAPDLGTGVDTGAPPTDVAGNGPEATPFAPGDGQGGGSGSLGGVGGASTNPGKEDAGGGDAAQYAGMSDRGAGYGSGASFGGGGSRRGKSDGGNSGIDLGSLLGQLLPGKEEKGKDSILDYGSRSPASMNDSLLDRGVNIFERVHDAYQVRGKKGVIGI